MKILKTLGALTLALFLTMPLFAKITPVKVGDKVPDYSYKDVNGKTYTQKDFAGKYIYIDIWATWCGPCVNEIPSLKKIEEKMHGKNIVFVSLSVDKDKEKWEDFVESNDMTGIQLYGGANNPLVNFFSVSMIPRFVIIGPTGKVVTAQAGRPSTGDKLVDYLNELPNM